MSKKKNNMDVLHVERLYDFSTFSKKDYINFTKRSGGQLFQYYSLLDSYAKYLGANGGSEFSAAYRETQVVFSREIFKKRVYSSVILPLYTEDSSTNSINIVVGSEIDSTEERSYFKPRLTPSWYDRHTNSFSFVSGDFRNIYRSAVSKAESMINNSISFVSGDFRLPLLTYVHKEVDSITMTKIYFEEGSLKKVLLKALIPTESFKTEGITATGAAKSTDKEKDMIEINFSDINYVSESPKVIPTILDKFSTKISSFPEPKYLRVLNKRGGVGIRFDGNSSSISSFYDWTINFNFEAKELRPDSHVLDYPGHLTIRYDSRDASKIIINVAGETLYTSVAGFIQINSWYNVSIEKTNNEYKFYLNSNLIATAVLPLKTFFKNNDYFTIGNSVDTYNGFIGNISNFIIVKRAALITDSFVNDYTEITPVIGSEIDFSLNDIRDKNPGVVWNNYNAARYDSELKGISFTSGQYLIAEEAPDISIYNFNNFKIDVEFSISSVPTLDNKTKTLLHKTGAIGTDTYEVNSGYSLSVVRVDDIAKLSFQLGRASMLSTTTLRVGVRYSTEIIKYKTQLLLFINGVFEGNLPLSNPLDEDLLSRLIIGRFQTLPERDFKGILYRFKITNYFRDTSTNSYLMQYMPENLEYEEILTFEEGILNWQMSDKTLTEEDYITTTNPKFGKKALLLDTSHKAIIRPNTPLYNLKTNDFTFEGWVNPVNFSTQSVVISNGTFLDSTNSVLLQYLYIDSAGLLTFYTDKLLTGLASNIVVKSNKPLLLNTWSHIVLLRDKGVFKLYQNGMVVGETTLSNVTVDFSISNTYIGNNNSKGNLLPVIVEPTLIDYVLEDTPASIEALNLLLEDGGLISVPDTPLTDFNVVDGILTIGDMVIEGSNASEIEVLRTLHFNKFVVLSDLKKISEITVFDWVVSKGLLLKSRPEPTILPPSTLTNSSQFQGRMDSIRLVKDEAMYSGNSFDIPSTSYGDTDSNTIIKLSFDYQYKANPDKEMLLEFKPTPFIEKVNTLVINAESIADEVLSDNFESVIFNFDNGLTNEGNFVQDIVPGSVSVNTTVKHLESKTLNSAYKAFSIKSGDSSKNIFMFEGKDFTLDTWIYETSEPAYWWKMFDNGYPTYTSGSSYNEKGMTFGYNRGNDTIIGATGIPEVAGARSLLPLNKWNHLAIAKEGTKLRFFINGILKAESDVDVQYSNYNTGSGLVFLGSGWSSTEFLKGYVSNVRIVRGKALFVKNFDTNLLTKPTANLSNVLEKSFVAETNTTLELQNTLYNDRSISYNNSGIVYNTKSSAIIDNIENTEDFTLEMYINFSSNTNRYQTILSNVQLPEHIAHYFNMFRYNDPQDLSLHHRIALTKNAANLDDILYLSDAQFLDNQWYNITLVKVDNQLKLFVNGLLDSRQIVSNFNALFKNVGFRLGNSIVDNTAMTGYIESFRFTPELSLYKNSFDPENIYLKDENSVRYNYSESTQTVYESIAKKNLVNIDNANTSIVNNVLVTKLPDDTSRTGVTIPSTTKGLDFSDKDFTFVIKVKLPEKRYGRVTTVYCNRPSTDNLASFLNISSDSDTATAYPFRSSITLYVKQSSIELNLGERSFQEGVWNTIAITRSEYSLRVYVNGDLKGNLDLTDKNLDLKLNAYGGMRLLDAGRPQAGEIDTVYGLVGESLYSGNSYVLPRLVNKNSYYEDRFSITKEDNKNVIPNKTFVESLYTKTESFANVTSKNSLIKSSLQLDGNSYVKLNEVPKIPKNFIVSFWMKPTFKSNATDSYYSVFKWESDDEYNIDYSITPSGIDKLLITKGSLREELSSSTSGISFIPSEWNHIIITKYENTAAVYINGYRVRMLNSLRYGEMFSNLPSTVRLGYNPSLPTKSIDLLIDDLKLSKYKEGLDLGLYLNSLGTLIDDYKLNLTPIDINNFDGSKELDNWENLSGNVMSKFDSTLGKYYFTQRNPTTTVNSITQTIDVSEYLDISSNKMYFQWTQSYDNSKYNYDNSGSCILECFDKNMELLGTVSSQSLNVYSYGVQDREIERYLVVELAINVAYITVKVSLKNSSYITNMKMFIEDTGQRFDNLDFEEEIIKPGSSLPYSHAFLLAKNEVSEAPIDLSLNFKDLEYTYLKTPIIFTVNEVYTQFNNLTLTII